tara:strand:- start:77 stop:427 length:351 start_codon:yes stop_codon:yes gene_type:complete
MATLELLDEETWEPFINAPISVLILSKNDCNACSQLCDELGVWFSTEPIPSNIRFGKIMLDHPGMGRFKITHRWVSNVDVMPFMAIFVDGERVSEWSGSNLSRFQRQIQQVLETIG